MPINGSLTSIWQIPIKQFCLETKLSIARQNGSITHRVLLAIDEIPINAARQPICYWSLRAPTSDSHTGFGQFSPISGNWSKQKTSPTTHTLTKWAEDGEKKRLPNQSLSINLIDRLLLCRMAAIDRLLSIRNYFCSCVFLYYWLIDLDGAAEINQ